MNHHNDYSLYSTNRRDRVSQQLRSDLPLLLFIVGISVLCLIFTEGGNLKAYWEQPTVGVAITDPPDYTPPTPLPTWSKRGDGPLLQLYSDGSYRVINDGTSHYMHSKTTPVPRHIVPKSTRFN